MVYKRQNNFFKLPPESQTMKAEKMYKNGRRKSISRKLSKLNS